MKTVILVAGSGNTTGMNVISALRDHYDIIGCDCNKVNPADLLCKNYQVPIAADTSYQSVILDIIKKNKISHIIASNDHDLRALVNINQEIKELGARLNGYSTNILKFLDKDATYEYFIEKGICTPLVYKQNPKLPFVLRKRNMGNERKFVHIIKNDSEFERVPEWDKQFGIYTEYIDGEEYTIDVLCDEEANVLSATPRLRVEVRGGMVWHGKIVHDKKLLDKIKDVCKKVNIVGLACLQCIKNSGEYYFIEINPRPGSGIDLSIAGGNNLPLLWVKLSNGEDIKIVEPNWDLELQRYYKGYFFKS